MYARQTASGRSARGMNIPANYSGNAFASDTDEAIQNAPEYSEHDIPSVNEEDTAEVSEPVSAKEIKENEKRTESAGLFQFFGGSSGGIGLEELLILGLVILISQNDTKDDLAFLLLILLFIR
ncbi:MAG: hypothetical protein IJ011_05140 [Clostridia bacterium]|nr:hypothetical protein [Clostridia bacterium]